MLFIANLFKRSKSKSDSKAPVSTSKAPPPNKQNEKVAARKGEIGEYKIDIQLDQLPKDHLHLSDLLIKNEKALTGYSQIDHVVICPFGIFVIETKNYQGIIYEGKKFWSVNGKFKMMNPFIQNYGHIKALESTIDKDYSDLFISMVSFTKRSTFKVDLSYRKVQSNQLIVYDVELSDYIHRKISVLKLVHKVPLLNAEEAAKIFESFSKANILDPAIRKLHIERAKNRSKERAQTSLSCSVCKKPVSEKVKNFCLTNKRFKGKIYCYDHQKVINLEN
ncbi:nuclease-related domain-containing protein [Alkalihalophilus pseudofirmus]|uniref:Nuclease-related domain-containing protein n=1 Tax=Alkalihalophilus pseudofirmus TaxID=79885 RepID=A0AAJ2NPV2_ALKPS|nr:nuclease-related domain-containing protein [Alkalihalophilus pseudofirmus]MDV2886371.1 nuclease-related domain-containing protein [Alkalihalophilus pseudofirmus]